MDNIVRSAYRLRQGIDNVSGPKDPVYSPWEDRVVMCTGFHEESNTLYIPANIDFFLGPVLGPAYRIYPYDLILNYVYTPRDPIEERQGDIAEISTGRRCRSVYSHREGESWRSKQLWRKGENDVCITTCRSISESDLPEQTFATY